MTDIPQHIAVIMDGNGRWAQKQRKPRIAGHKAGFERAREIVQACAERGVQALTLFAFSSENWSRPATEVSALLELFAKALQWEVKKLHKHNIRIQFIGDRERFSASLQGAMSNAEQLTKGNSAMTLVLAVNYGGHWDLWQAALRLAKQAIEDGRSVDDLSIDDYTQHLSLAKLPVPDLFIRTSGEQRISNFCLWDLAYTELYFTDTYWPDFNDHELTLALTWFQSRQRRFGKTAEQVEQNLA